MLAGRFERPSGAPEAVSAHPRVPSARYASDSTLGYSRSLPPGGIVHDGDNRPANVDLGAGS